jgi:hypothetical protein
MIAVVVNPVTAALGGNPLPLTMGLTAGDIRQPRESDPDSWIAPLITGL